MNFLYEYELYTLKSYQFDIMRRILSRQSPISSTDISPCFATNFEVFEVFVFLQKMKFGKLTMVNQLESGNLDCILTLNPVEHFRNDKYLNIIEGIGLDFENFIKNCQEQ